MNIEIISRIIPKNGQNFPVVEDKYVHGGFHVASSFAEVSMESRKEGMLIYLQGDSKYYKLIGGLDDSFWVEVSLEAVEKINFLYDATVPASSDGYVISAEPFSVENDKVYSLAVSATLASTESDMTANFCYKVCCRGQAGVILVDSVNEISAYDPSSYFTINFMTTGLDSNLNFQLENASGEEVAVRISVVKENEVSRV